MAKQDEYVVRAGVTYDDKERMVFPYGLKWIEVSGIRLPNCGLQSVTSRNAHDEFGTVEIVLGGARFEQVDAETAPEPTDWKAGFSKLVRLLSPDVTVGLNPDDWTAAEWDIITEHAR